MVPESPRTPKWRHQACQMTPMGTKIHKKSVKIQAWNSKCPLLCSQVSQNRPKVPKHAKVKPPIMLNDRFAHQECQGPLPTMPRNCNPEAASADRGPAAEGVAHKIISGCSASACSVRLAQGFTLQFSQMCVRLMCSLYSACLHVHLTGGASPHPAKLRHMKHRKAEINNSKHMAVTCQCQQAVSNAPP